MEGSILVHELRKVIKIVDLLRDIGLDQQLSLPKVVVLGNQSSGKSSLLEQIVGLDFLPRGSGVVTRRPLELRMNNIQDLKVPYAEFDEVMDGNKKKRFTNFNEVRKTIEDVTEKVCGSKKIIKNIPIVLNIFSNSCPNLTIVDLPGITSIPVGQQPKNIYEITRDMALHYIKEPRSIILCVIPANQDLSTSEALKIMREIDKSGSRSIGCLTKIDIMNRGDDATKILKNQQIPLRYGYVGIKNRCQEDVINNVPVSQSLKSEREFFTKSPIYSTLPPDTFSTESLTKKLTGILYQQIKSSMPEIFEQIKKKRAESEEELQKLGPGIANTDGQLVNYAWKSVSSFMRIFTNSINGIKSPDYNAEPISSEIREELGLLYRDQYDTPATEDTSDKEIQKAMINFPGENIPGFPSIDAFLALLNPLLKKLQNPAYSVNNHIYEVMDREACKIINEIMIKKFPEFNSRFTDLIRKVLEKHRKDLQTYLNFLLDSELNYLYTNDTSYLMGDFAMTDKEKKKLESGKIKDPLIFELRKRIDSYYKLAVRNLRDLVPRQAFNFLIVKCLKQLQFEAFQFTSDVNKLKQLLNEPEEIRQRRKQCIKAIKVFEESEKRIRMDPDIAKLIRNTKKESKYYEKYGIKSPEEQEKEAEQHMKKITEEEVKKINNQRKQPPRDGRGGAQRTPSQQSNNSTVTNTSNRNQEKKEVSKQSMFNMFGTNVAQPQTRPNNKPQTPQLPVQKQAQQSGQQQTSQQQQMRQPPQQATQPVQQPVQTSMGKQPTIGVGTANSSNHNDFADFWGQPKSQVPKQNQPQQPRNVQPQPPQQVQPPKNVQPQQSQVPKNVQPPQQSQEASKPQEKKNRSTTFNQLFGLKN